MQLNIAHMRQLITSLAELAAFFSPIQKVALLLRQINHDIVIIWQVSQLLLLPPLLPHPPLFMDLLGISILHRGE